MRLYEFTTAEEQLTLLRTIMDNTWRAIEQQAIVQRAHKDTVASDKAKQQPSKKRKTSSKRKRPAPPPPPKPKALPVKPALSITPSQNSASVNTKPRQNAASSKPSAPLKNPSSASKSTSTV